MRGLIRISNHDAGTLCDGSRDARIYGPDRSLPPDLMSAAIFSESTAIHLGLKRQVVTALLFSLAANVLLSGVLLVKPSPVLTIVIPPEAASAEAGWIFTEKGVHSKYLEKWALSLTALVATMSPTTMEANIRRLLEHTAPEVHGELERRLMREIESLKADRVASVFYPSRTRVDAERLTVDIEGERRLLIGSKVTSVQKVVLRVRARYDAGRLHLTSLAEVPAEEAARLFPA